MRNGRKGRDKGNKEEEKAEWKEREGGGREEKTEKREKK